MNPELPNTASCLERQQTRMKWQQQQQCFFNGNDHHHLRNMFTSGLIDNHPDIVKPDPGMDEGWAVLDGSAYGDQFCYGYMNQDMGLKMTNCTPLGAGAGAGAGADQTFLQGNSTSVSASLSVSPKKRKADKGQSLQVVSEKEKRIKGCAEEADSKITHQNSNHTNKAGDTKEASTNTSSKDKSKVSEVQKPDYIHVRARRGQATDSHSLAERVRREKISERMKYLQDLVPGCNKITGKAGMLDEIINYVQSLQKQVEFLSMKLATVNPELDFNIDNVITKEMLQSSTSEFPALGCSSANAAYFQLNSIDQMVSYCGFDIGINSSEIALRRSISAPISIPETFLDSSCFNQVQPTATWDADLQNLYKMEFEQGTLMPFQSHQFTGSNGGSNLKMGT